MRGIIFPILLVLMIYSVSAEIIINQQPEKIYNIGDILKIPATVTSNIDVYGSFDMNLLCNGKETNFYRNGISLSSGEQTTIDTSLAITRGLFDSLNLNVSAVICRIKSLFGEEYKLSDEFKISDLISVNLKTPQSEFNPGETLVIEGEATRENGKGVDGYVDLIFVENKGNSTKSTTHQGTVSGGFFSVSFSLSKEIKAGMHLVQINVYEKNSVGVVTNRGFADYNVLVKQIPTSLEIVFREKNVEPGTNFGVKTILHDQTGEKIDSTSIITIKDKNNKILEQIEKKTDEFLEFPISYNQKPEEWKVFVVSNKLSREALFNIAEKEEVKVEIINRTLILTNTGNVPYNKTILIKIGGEPLNVNPYLQVDEVKKYVLSAPDGEYNVEIMNNGISRLSEMVSLTGNAVDVREATRGVLNSGNISFAWIFVVFILGFIVAVFFKRGYKKSFFGYIPPSLKQRIRESSAGRNQSSTTGNKAELSLALKGEKQNPSIVCIKIKNLDGIAGNIEETIARIAAVSEDNKAFIYKSEDYLFLIIAPVVTKTFKNEINALKTAKQIKEIIDEHNRKFRQRIEFGISLNDGDMIIQMEENKMKFMSFGNLMTLAKKISSVSDGEILLSEAMKNKLISKAKVERCNLEGVDAYVVREIKEKSDENKKFVNELVKKWERE
ncbi:MAG: hypothetical protein AABX28_01910 [Nanoarchaeota archaeon]